jgi:adenine-specific DNA-methyltransferase
MRYIGSKARVVDDLMELIGSPVEEDGVFVDGFCGTGVVAAKAADRGWSVRLNDNLLSAVVVATARLLSSEQVPFEELGGYEGAIEKLNAAEPVEGFIWREYSSAGPAGRRYFTAANAARIDAARQQLRSWEAAERLTTDERSLLKGDLIAAAGRVANIAGTYGCYLSRWTPTALQPFALQPRELRQHPVPHSAYCGDVADTPMAEDDVAYFDPPYTKRQYAAYYHLNETLAWGDEPDVAGKTGLRPWQDRASDYCYKRRALAALQCLIENAPARRVFLSYSSQGHIELEGLCSALEPLGDLSLHEVGPVGRYRPNPAASSAGDQVTEFLIEIERAPAVAGAPS